MADAKQYNAVTGFNPADAPGGSAGSEPPSKILSEDIRDLKHDLWAAFWGPGPNCPNFNSGTEADRRIGWNQDPDGVHGEATYKLNTNVNRNKLGGISGYPAASNSTNGAVATSSVSVTHPQDTTNPSSNDEVPVDFIATPDNNFNYPTTTGPAYFQIQALIARVNISILHTGHGSSSNATMPNLSTAGSYTKYDGSAASALTEDTGRVSKRHLDRISEEIEYLRADYSRANKLNKGDSSYHSENPFSGSVTTVGEWGSDRWGGNIYHPSGSGTDTGIQRCFTEMKMTFDNFSSLRYYFNQGSQLAWEGEDSNGSRAGDATWNTIHDHRVYFGANDPEYRTGSGNTGANSTQTNVSWVSANTGSYTVTDYCPRIHGIGDKTNAMIEGTGATSTDGRVITGMSSTSNISPGDMFRVHNSDSSFYPYAGEVKSVDSSSQITLRRKLRMGYTGAESSSFSDKDWVVCKWYRAGYLKGAGSLYGGGGDSGSVGDPSADDGYIYFDWALSVEPGTSGKIAVIMRSMADNSVNHMRMGDMNVHNWGPSQADSIGEFAAEAPGTLSFEWATAEDEWDGSANVRYEYRQRFATDV